MTYTLRILSGPLTGVEVALPAQDIFFLVGDAPLQAAVRAANYARKAEQCGAAGVVRFPEPAHTLFVPSAAENGRHDVNFTLHLSEQIGKDNLDETAVRVTLHGVGTESDQLFRLAEPCQLGSLWIAVSAPDAPLPDSLKTFSPEPHQPLSVTQTHDPRDDRGVTCPPSQGSTWRRHRTRTFTALGAAAIIGTVCLGGARLAATGTPVPAAPATVVKQRGVHVVKAADGITYAIADARLFNAVRRRLTRNGVAPSNARWLVTQMEIERFRTILRQSPLQGHGVDLSDPTHPIVETPAQKDRFASDTAERMLRTAFPYIREVEFKERQANLTAHLAARDLRAAGIPIDLSETADGTMLRIRGELSDQQLLLIESIGNGVDLNNANSPSKLIFDVSPMPFRGIHIDNGRRSLRYFERRFSIQ